MTKHCFDIIYSPSGDMDNYLSSWLTSWTGWAEESLSSPESKEFSDADVPVTSASGFQENRFEIEDTEVSPKEDAEYIVSALTGSTGFLAAYCDWWIIRRHECFHDEDGECGDWVVIDSSEKQGNTAIPNGVPQ